MRKIEIFRERILETHSNARLIAAAPEMLDALIACYNHIKNDMTVRGIGMNARRAIESATGESIDDLTSGHITQGGA